MKHINKENNQTKGYKDNKFQIEEIKGIAIFNKKKSPKQGGDQFHSQIMPVDR